MPFVRNPSGIVVSVPDDHWALTDPEFKVLPEPEPEREPPPRKKPARKR